jgi:hypothetical protein
MRIARSALLALLSCPLLAAALTIEPLPGSTPQATRKYAAFPQAIGAIVRDDAGNPVMGATVRFSVAFGPGGYAFFLTMPASTTIAIVATGTDGIAMAPAPLMATSEGPIALTADVPGVTAPIAYDLVASGSGPTRLDVVSGNNQRAFVNTIYPLPWIARAVGNDGAPVPYAALQLYARPDAVPSGTFDGRNTLYLIADAQGVATSPAFTANAIAGSQYGSMDAFTDADAASVFAFFNYENVSDALFANLLGTQPTNAPVGGSAAFPFAAIVYNAFGQLATAAPFTWHADPSCGRFLGQVSYSALTDVNGRAVSPPMEAVAPSLACGATLTVNGGGVGTAIHTFAPESIALFATTGALDTVTNAATGFTVVALVDGLHVYYPATITVTTGKSGASASVVDVMQYVDEGDINLTLFTNNKLGNYDVIVRMGTVQVVVPVTQKRH